MKELKNRDADFTFTNRSKKGALKLLLKISIMKCG
jgi:hypothetical protein